MNQSIDRHSFRTQCTREKNNPDSLSNKQLMKHFTDCVVAWRVFFLTDSLFSTDPSTSRRSDWFQTRPFGFLGNALRNCRSTLRDSFTKTDQFTHTRKQRGAPAWRQRSEASEHLHLYPCVRAFTSVCVRKAVLGPRVQLSVKLWES